MFPSLAKWPRGPWHRRTNGPAVSYGLRKRQLFCVKMSLRTDISISAIDQSAQAVGSYGWRAAGVIRLIRCGSFSISRGQRFWFSADRF